MFTFCIDSFGCARKISNELDCLKAVNVYELNAKAAECGYIIHPDCCTEEVGAWLDNQTRNYNATFYKTWEDVTSRNRLELLIDQLIHYATTYGTDMQGAPYIPNENFDQENARFNVPAIKELKLILPISDEELFEKCRETLYAGIALKSETLKNFIEFISFYLDKGQANLDIDAVKNRDAVCMLSAKTGILPKDAAMALRVLVFKATGKPNFVQNQGLFFAIQHGASVDLSALSNDDINKFATIFNRFKRVFLSFKQNGKADNINNGPVVNRISKLSKTLHVPMEKGFWESILEVERSPEEIAAHLKTANNFKKVRIMELAAERMNAGNDQAYTIRNGKIFVRKGYKPAAVSEGYCQTLYNMCRKSLVESLRPKACEIKLPTNCELALPSSEKNFVGNFPFGTSYKFAENNVVGIYWRNEWGTFDFDLSFIDDQGNKIGWNSDFYKDSDVIYSGDITNANPEAVELMYMSRNAPDAIVNINRFYGKRGSKFRLFFAQEDLSQKEDSLNYMVDPNSIKWDIMTESENEQQVLGFISDNTFYLMDLQMGNSRVAHNSELEQTFINITKERTKHFVKLSDILLEAGFTPIDDNSESSDDSEKRNIIDFCNLEKNTIIQLMA